MMDVKNHFVTSFPGRCRGSGHGSAWLEEARAPRMALVSACGTVLRTAPEKPSAEHFTAGRRPNDTESGRLFHDKIKVTKGQNPCPIE